MPPRGKRAPAPPMQPTARTSEGPRPAPPKQPAPRGGRAPQDSSSGDEEKFDLDDPNASDGSDDSDSDSESDHGPATRPTPEPSRKSSRKAEDIAHFFDRSDGKCAVCKVCRERSESSSGYTYSAKTSTSTLRTHLDRLHRKEYIRLCDEKGWKNQLKSSRTEGESRAAAGSQSQPPRAPFTQERFLDFLVKFIVATNQSAHIVESPAFRELLLYLRPGLQIPSVSDVLKLMPKNANRRNA